VIFVTHDLYMYSLAFSQCWQTPHAPPWFLPRAITYTSTLPCTFILLTLRPGCSQSLHLYSLYTVCFIFEQQCRY